ncbi:MAG: MATE family efflux transporter [Lachnospiraceae bacterium]|nr:MATE family efflux transporter [Lachnospiraceae bacterium]
MENKQDFTQGSIFGKMVQFMVPILGALILQAMYGAVDLLIVGRFGTNAGISAVSTGSSIMNLVTFVLSALATGVTILLGRYLGEKRQDKIGKLIGGAVAFFLIFAAVLTAALILFARPIAILMQAPAEAVDLTVQYIRICGAGFLFVVFYNLISCIFRGLGNSRLPLLFVAIACVVNIVGDLLLVAVFHMNVAGAAIATIAAQAVSVVLSIVIILRSKLLTGFSVKDVRFGKEVGAFVKVGFPLALQELLTNASFLALCAFINRLGLDASNGYGIAQKIQSFVMLIPGSIMQCMASFVAQNVGAGKEERAKKGMLYGMAVGAGIGVVIAVLAFFKGDMLASVFSDNERDIARAFEYLRGFALEAIITCILFSFLGYFNGHSKSMFVMLQGLAQSFLIRLPMSYVMSIQPDASLTWIGLAAPTATIFGIILCLIYYWYMNTHELKMHGEAAND